MRCSMLTFLLATLPLHLGAQNPTGRWTLEFWTDSAGAIGPRPTARYMRGKIGFDTLHADTETASNGQRWTRQYLGPTAPNKRLKLTGPALGGSLRLCASQQIPQRGGACACRRSPRSLSAIR